MIKYFTFEFCSIKKFKKGDHLENHLFVFVGLDCLQNKVYNFLNTCGDVLTFLRIEHCRALHIVQDSPESSFAHCPR